MTEICRQAYSLRNALIKNSFTRHTYFQLGRMDGTTSTLIVLNIVLRRLGGDRTPELTCRTIHGHSPPLERKRVFFPLCRNPVPVDGSLRIYTDFGGIKINRAAATRAHGSPLPLVFIAL